MKMNFLTIFKGRRMGQVHPRNSCEGCGSVIWAAGFLYLLLPIWLYIYIEWWVAAANHPAISEPALVQIIKTQTQCLAYRDASSHCRRRNSCYIVQPHTDIYNTDPTCGDCAYYMDKIRMAITMGMRWMVLNKKEKFIQVNHNYLHLNSGTHRSEFLLWNVSNEQKLFNNSNGALVLLHAR